MIRIKDHDNEKNIHYERPRLLTRVEESFLVQENNNIEELHEDIVLKKMDIIAKLIFLVILYIFFLFSGLYIIIQNSFILLYDSHPTESLILIFVSFIYYLL